MGILSAPVGLGAIYFACACCAVELQHAVEHTYHYCRENECLKLWFEGCEHDLPVIPHTLNRAYIPLIVFTSMIAFIPGEAWSEEVSIRVCRRWS